ncbi:MAG: hypothetical protein GY794_12810 [bacterium]|nr:hypothetical protein [bacterium]
MTRSRMIRTIIAKLCLVIATYRFLQWLYKRDFENTQQDAPADVDKPTAEL